MREKIWASVLIVLVVLSLWVATSAHFIVRMSLTEYIVMCIVGVIAGCVVIGYALKSIK